MNPSMGQYEQLKSFQKVSFNLADPVLAQLKDASTFQVKNKSARLPTAVANSRNLGKI